MADLPKEIYLEIFAHLPQRHLRSVSQTCRAFGTLVKPLLFEEISLVGDADPGRYYTENDVMNVHYPGRLKTVELSSLESTIDEIIALGIAPYVKKLKFGPKHYVEDFWRKYRQWVENEVEVDDEEDFHRMYDEEDFEDDEEFGYAGIRRIAEERRARPEKERNLIEAAEEIWTVKVAQQREKAEANKAALTRLFAHMPNLRRIDICEWKCEFGEYGIEDRIDDDVERQFAGCKPTWEHLKLLSHAIQASNTRIKHLTLPAIDMPSIRLDSSVENLFKSLTTLSFNMEDIDFMHKESRQNISDITKLMTLTSSTLQHLEFRNISTSHPQLPQVGEHFLERIFGSSSTDATTEITVTTPLVFPKLKTLKLRSMILNTPSLIAYLSIQPVLEYALFEYIYIATMGYTWADVAQALPQSCSKFYISQCGHERYGPDSPVASNHIKDFRPYRDPFPAHVGWRASDAFFQNEQDERDREEAKRANWVLPPGMQAMMAFGERDERTKDERVQQLKMCYNNSEFERI